MVKINCIEVLKTPNEILLVTGLWPTLRVTKYEIVKQIFNLIFNLTLLTLITLNLLNAVRYDNLKQLNWMTCMLIPMVNYSAKSFTLFANKSSFLSLVDDLKSEIFNSHSEKLNKHIQLINKLSKLMMRYFVLTLTSYLLVASLMPIIINTGMMIPPPFDVGRFDMLYKILHLFGSSYLAVNSACFDVLFLTLMGLCIAQLNILEEKLNCILEDSELFHANTEDVKLMVECNLRRYIGLHELINQFVKKLSTLLSLPLFIQYTCGCFIICNAILQMTILGEAVSTNTISICAYTGVIFGQMTAYHWIGNEIIFKSNKVIESCYTSKWYELEIKFQKSLLLLTERAKRPLIVQVYGLVFLSLDSLGVVVKWTYSLFALMKARYS